MHVCSSIFPFGWLLAWHLLFGYNLLGVFKLGVICLAISILEEFALIFQLNGGLEFPCNALHVAILKWYELWLPLALDYCALVEITWLEIGSLIVVMLLTSFTLYIHSLMGKLWLPFALC